MKTMSAREAKNAFGLMIYIARAWPVLIEKHGRGVVMVISVEEYERLSRLADDVGKDTANVGEVTNMADETVHLRQTHPLSTAHGIEAECRSVADITTRGNSGDPLARQVVIELFDDTRKRLVETATRNRLVHVNRANRTMRNCNLRDYTRGGHRTDDGALQNADRTEID